MRNRNNLRDASASDDSIALSPRVEYGRGWAAPSHEGVLLRLPAGVVLSAPSERQILHRRQVQSARFADLLAMEFSFDGSADTRSFRPIVGGTSAHAGPWNEPVISYVSPFFKMTYIPVLGMD